ncbi:LOW QUALITY PROTEIN: amino acid ABC transporter, partial [Brucella pinnipedialis M292/94/1]
QRFNLWPGLSGWPCEYALCRRARCCHGINHRISGRHRSSFAQLADSQYLHGLCGGLPQYSAATRYFLLVFRRSVGFAPGAPKLFHAAFHLYQQSRLLHAIAGLGRGAWALPVALLIGILASFAVARWAKRRQMATGQPFHTIRVSAALIIGLPILALIATGFPVSFDVPKLGTFNLTGGAQIKPEFLALFLALSFYTASFIAETVRAGVLGVSKGQTEAAYAVGLRSGQTMRLIIVPQALRIIIPPLSSQYLNLIKNSSLAIAIGYPDLVAVGGTILNQTGQAVEVVAIWMVIYLGISLIVSGLMNWFNAKMALVER